MTHAENSPVEFSVHAFNRDPEFASGYASDAWNTLQGFDCSTWVPQLPSGWQFTRFTGRDRIPAAEVVALFNRALAGDALAYRTVVRHGVQLSVRRKQPAHH